MVAAGTRDRGAHRGQAGGARHWCSFDESARREAAPPWVHEGLAARNRILWLTAGHPDATLRELEDVLPEVHGAVRARRVTILRLDRVLPVGTASEVAALTELIDREAERAAADGLGGLRLVIELDAVADEGDAARVDRLELALAVAVADGLCSALCIYPASSRAGVRLAALRSHGTVVDKGRPLSNPAALDVGSLRAEDRTRVASQRWLEALRQTDRSIEAARQVGERLRGVVDDLPVAMVTLDECARVVQATEEALWLFGRTGEQLRGVPFQELVAADQVPLVNERLAEIHAAGSLRGVTLRVARPDGTVRLVELSARLAGVGLPVSGPDSSPPSPADEPRRLDAADGGAARQGGGAAPRGEVGPAPDVAVVSSRLPLVRCVLHDTTTLRRSRQELMRQNREIELRHRVARLYADDPSPQAHVELLRLVLDTVGGRFGVVVRGDDADSMSGWLLGGRGARRGAEQVRALRLPGGTETAGAWGRALEARAGVWSNESELLAGVIPVEKVLVVPVLWRGQCAGVLAVADGPRDYEEADCALTEVVAREAASMLATRGRRSPEGPWSGRSDPGA